MGGERQPPGPCGGMALFFLPKADMMKPADRREYIPAGRKTGTGAEKPMDFTDCLRAQAALHPSMEPQDAVKLCYQAAFGAEHLLADPEGAWKGFQTEFVSAPDRGAALYEWISPDFCRADLTAWRERGLPPEWLFRMFRYTASAAAPDGAVHFKTYTAVTEDLALAGALPFPADQWRQFSAQYAAGGPPWPLHHSEAYRRREHPAYRILDGRLTRLFPLLLQLAALPARAGARVVAIDGRAASGKSTMAAQLAEILCAGVVHMDDFFLPPELRTERRLAQPGGNVHYERFAEEVLPYLSGPAAFSYRRFDCSRMEYGTWRQVPEGGWRIVEGGYSGHPALGPYADLHVFSDISPEEQLCRLRVREDAESLNRFISRWIPLEESYFAACKTRAAADIVL